MTFLNASNTVRIDAVLTMAESRGLLKVLSRPRVVTQNNIQALVKQGVRVPIVTQAQLGGPPTVTYVDAFLRLDGDSADHFGEYDLPERGRGKHDPELRSGSAGQPGIDHAAGDNAGAGDRRRHGGDRWRHPDAELDQHHAGAGAGQHPDSGQPVQAHVR